VFAYRLETDLAKEYGLYDRYVLIRKIDEGNCYHGHTIPIVYLSITNDNKLPENSDEIQMAEYLPTAVHDYKSKKYRMSLLSTSNRIIPTKKLIYLGNFD
jgi:hypothetical protein